MTVTSKPSTNRTKDHSLPQLLPSPSVEKFPAISNPTMSLSRDLAPPSGLNRLPPPLTMSTPIPPLPAGWEGTEHMITWLKAKMEEDRRRLQEGKTQEANLILERRRIEQSMLSDALNGGVSPNLIPTIFSHFYTTSLNPQLAAEPKEQSATASRSAAPPVIPQQQSNQGPAPPEKLPVTPQRPRRDLKQPSRAQASGVLPMTTKSLPGTPHSQWDEEISSEHREQLIDSQREELKRMLKSQNKECADMKLLDTAFDHTFPIMSSMLPAQSPRNHAGPPNKASGTRRKRQQAPQEAQPRSTQESGPQSQAQQGQTKMPPSNPISVSNGLSHFRPEQTNSPRAKRKDQRSHEKLPPPRFRRNETVSDQPDAFDESQLDQKQQQRDVSSFHEYRTCKGSSSEQTSDSTSDTVGRSSATSAEELQKQSAHRQSSSDTVDASHSLQDMVTVIKLERD
ncbi:uncharacterized protein N7479_007484 [Penicillium vulpinum]|uniref:Uncharacterized protein n=1 Tax=Penicillium vulpinum TaxID=29845 RepID=A0A1V6SB87_9EURO|nr:uncharacterized protein N7479_007484 [Penicillium vulpinum]KAJ5960334.1 hypothetical protein N7479_007484 [Penicillium vulpinum]OQE11030.1 hypothetical protein PENVUL_c003G09601 [Penicillium vulpinum]